MVYIHHLRGQRWTRIDEDGKQSYFRIRLGKTSCGGCTIPALSVQESTEIGHWLLKKGIVRSARHLGDEGAGWSHRPFGYWYKTMGSEDLWYHGGVEFRLTLAAASLVQPDQR